MKLKIVTFENYSAIIECISFEFQSTLNGGWLRYVTSDNEAIIINKISTIKTIME